MAKLIMMVGLPGSGKSTLAKKMFGDKVILSSDDLRVEMFGHFEQNKNHELFNELHKRMWDNLNSGNDVVYDATNSNRKRRKHFISELKRKGHNVEVVFVATTISDILENNLTRPLHKQLPFDILIQKIRGFQVPLQSEGFSSIKVIQDRSESIRKYTLKTIGFDQNSAYHNETLDRHIKTVKMKIREVYRDDSSGHFAKMTNKGYLLWQVAHFHDLGKVYCQQRKSDETIGYNQHENVSAYIYMSDMPFLKENDQIATLIAYHMRIKQAKTDKAIKKLVSEIGEDNYNLLVEFNKYDSFRRDL